MPHLYFNQLIQTLNGFSGEMLENAPNFQFMLKLRQRLKDEFSLTDTEAFDFVTKLKLDLSESLSEEEITEIADATFNLITRLCTVWANKYHVTEKYVLLTLNNDMIGGLTLN